MREQSKLHIDRLTNLVRWLALTGFALGLGWKGQASKAAMGVLAFGAAWNLVLSLLNYFEYRLPSHAPLTLASDAVISSLLLYISAASGDLFPWAVLLPAATIGLHFGLAGRALSRAPQMPVDTQEGRQRLLEIHQITHKKIARELHDGPTQALAAIAMGVNLARRLLDRDVERSRQEMLKIEELARQTSKEMRYYQFAIMPLVLESSGLAAALEALVEKTAEMYGRTILLEIDTDAVAGLSPEQEEMLFYIIQEAVDNARQHAEAEHIWVRLTIEANRTLLVEIEDDGVGFEPGAAGRRTDRAGLGLPAMHTRSQLIGARLGIDTGAGRGTRIRVRVPLDDES